MLRVPVSVNLSAAEVTDLELPVKVCAALARHGVADDGTPTQTSVTLDGVTEQRAGEPSRHRPLDLAELPDLLDRLGAHLEDDETRRLTSVLQTLGPA